MTDGEGAAATTEDGRRKLTGGDSLDGGDPFSLFAEWLQAAAAGELNDPNAMSLATVDESGMPDVRMVLLKGFDPDGFVFYTNLESQKGRQLAGTPKAALCFHWKSLRRQVRVRGPVEPVDPAEADSYFSSRPRQSQIGAWASRQSAPLESKRALEEAVALVSARFGDGPIPRPPHWSGFRLRPEHIEFWRDGAFRLHDRIRFSHTGTASWTRMRLFP